MGKSSVRFKTLDGVPLDVVAETIRSIPLQTFMDNYEGALPDRIRKKRSWAR